MFNRPLLTPKTEEADLLEKQQEDSLVARMKMFVHLRQDLERVSHSITCTGIHSIRNLLNLVIPVGNNLELAYSNIESIFIVDRMHQD